MEECKPGSTGRCVHLPSCQQHQYIVDCYNSCSSYIHVPLRCCQCIQCHTSTCVFSETSCMTIPQSLPPVWHPGMASLLGPQVNKALCENWVHMMHMDAHDAHGCTWMHMDAHGCTWMHMDAHGRTWMHMDAHGCMWMHMDAIVMMQGLAGLHGPTLHACM